MAEPANVYTLRTTCPKCLAPEAFHLRLDRRQRPFLSCDACGGKVFARMWGPGDVHRLLAVGLYVSSSQGRQTIEQLKGRIAAADARRAGQLQPTWAPGDAEHPAGLESDRQAAEEAG